MGGVCIFERNITTLENMPTPLFEEFLVHCPWVYFQEIMVASIKMESARSARSASLGARMFLHMG